MFERAHSPEQRPTLRRLRRLTVTSLIAAIGALGSCSPPDDPGRDPGGAGAAPTQPCATSMADARAAERMARACGTRVEVESERTERSEVYIEPSGLHMLSTSVVPVRARRRDGTWSPIDTTLERVAGQIAPVASPAKVQFSAGGTGPFVTVERDGHRFTLSWPAALPAPSLSGDTATYADVLPDVDLVATATATGFTHLLVVKTARAAANPAVRHARYQLGGDATLTSTPEGGLVAASHGVTVASAERPTMWDSPSQGHAGVRAAIRGPVMQGRMSRVTAAVTTEHLVLTPDTAMLDDPAAAFPLVIDPVWERGDPVWNYASADNQNGPTTDSKIAKGDPSPAATCLRVGNDPDSTHQYRSFMQFAIDGVAGKQIVNAWIDGLADHTWKCGAKRPTYFYRTDAITTIRRQAWPGPALWVPLGNVMAGANEASCDEDNDPIKLQTTALLGDLQAVADAHVPSYFVGISAGENLNGLNETNTERWMRYFLNNFKLTIIFNTQPATPDNLTVDGKPCVSGANRPFVKTTTPILSAHVFDADGDLLDVWFAWEKWNGSMFVPEPGGGLQGAVPSGGTAVFNVTGNVDGGIYTFRSQSNDAPSHSPFSVSAVTNMPGNCEWQVDVSPPITPQVTSDVYLEGPTACPGGACGAVGQTGRFTFSSSPDTASFLWGWSDPPTTRVDPAALGGSASIDWTPTDGGPHTLFVRAVDRAGNESNKTYQFVVAAPSTAVARWLLNDPAGTSQLADDTGHGNAVAATGGTLGAPGRIASGPDGAARSAMQFDPTGNGVTTGSVLADTSKSFSLAAWVKLGDGSATRYAISQSAAVPAFQLEYSKGPGVWKLTAPSADGSQLPGAVATSVPRLNTWTHLVGSYDSAAHEMRIYVNGALETVATGITVRKADGSIQIGRSWAGAIAEVQVWNRVISAAEAFALADPLQVGSVGEWHMESVGPGPEVDASPLAHDLTFFNGAMIPGTGAGQFGTGLRLDGVDDYAATDGQVVHTDQSFTVSLWARPATTTTYQSFISQQGTALPGFSLYFAPESGGLWKFQLYGSPTNAATSTFVSVPALAPTTLFHHLIGVFDAQKLEVRLYVDGALAATTAVAAPSQPWDATGPLLIGRRHDGPTAIDFTHGDLDEVRVYQGAVTDVTQIH